jgi:DNA-binding transcriptional LysR family regulator
LPSNTIYEPWRNDVALQEQAPWRAVENGIGTGVLPDYLNKPESGLVQLMTLPTVDCDLVYPEAMNSVARVREFRDFLVANAQRGQY